MGQVEPLTYSQRHFFVFTQNVVLKPANFTQQSGTLKRVQYRPVVVCPFPAILFPPTRRIISFRKRSQHKDNIGEVLEYLPVSDAAYRSVHLEQKPVRQRQQSNGRPEPGRYRNSQSFQTGAEFPEPDDGVTTQNKT